jgi:hypothetical protein
MAGLTAGVKPVLPPSSEPDKPDGNRQRCCGSDRRNYLTVILWRKFVPACRLSWVGFTIVPVCLAAVFHRTVATGHSVAPRRRVLVTC